MTRDGPPPESALDSLSPRQERFARLYRRSGNAKQAAVLAGYSVRSGKQIGSVLLKKPQIRRALDALREAQVPDEPDLTAELALRMLVEETADPNPRVRLDAKKAVAQAVGTFARKDDPGAQECSRCRPLMALERLSTEELELVTAGSDKQRLIAMSQTCFLEWATGVRAQAERWIEIARGFRGEAVEVAGQLEPNLIQPGPSQGPSN